VLALTRGCGDEGGSGGGGVVGGDCIVAAFVVGRFGDGGRGGSTSSATVKEPRCAEGQQRQHDPGRYGRADRSPAGRTVPASAVVLQIKSRTPSLIVRSQMKI